MFFAATDFVIRDASVADVPELVRLGWATSEDWPSGQILVGEIHGVVGAALAIDENRAIHAEMEAAPRVLARMRLRANGILAYRRAPAVADRIRGGLAITA